MSNFINKNVYTYLKGYLKKMEFDVQDFKNVHAVTLSAFDMGGKFISNSLEDLKNFNNLQDLQISNYILNRENIEIISQLENVQNYIFHGCDFKDSINISGSRVQLSNCQKTQNVIFENVENLALDKIDLQNMKIVCQSLELRFCENVSKSKIMSENISFKDMEFEAEDLEYIKENAKVAEKVTIFDDSKDIKAFFEGTSNVQVLPSVRGKNIG